MTSRPPGPKSRFPGQHLIAFRRDPIAFLRILARDYGDIVRFQFGPQEMILVNDPDLIRDVLVTNAHQFHKGRGLQRAKQLLGEGLLTSERPYHLRQRRLMQPAFHRQRIAAYGGIMVEEAAKSRSRWTDGMTEDIAEEMMRLTLAIVGKTLFDTDLDDEAPELGNAMTEVIQLFNLIMLPFAETLMKLPLPAVRRFRKARARLDATIYRLIDEHRRGAQDRGDLLSMLLSAQDDDAAQTRMTDEQVRDEAMTIFTAGHETTANALTWTWYLLSQNPDAERKFHQEIDSVLHDRLPDLEDLPRLPYTRRVLAESLRLYPPGWVIGRRALSDYPLGNFIAPSGSVLLLCESVMHVDPRYYADPMRFDPERWAADAETNRPKFSYFPFGGGPRVCIGEQFAWMEGILLLATLGRRWRFRLAPGQRVAGKPIITLRPKYGMRMVFEQRQP